MMPRGSDQNSHSLIHAGNLALQKILHDQNLSQFQQSVISAAHRLPPDALILSVVFFPNDVNLWIPTIPSLYIHTHKHSLNKIPLSESSGENSVS